MATLSKIIAEEARGSLPQENRGLPAFDLLEMQGVEIPMEYDIISVLGDILMCEIVDETKDGQVMRNGIIVPQEMQTKMWRVGKVLLKGPQCSEHVNAGDYIMYPSDKGIPMISHEKKKLVFLNEARMFCVCKPRK